MTNTETIYEKLSKVDTLENSIVEELVSYTECNSRGIINLVVESLLIIKERIVRGDKIVYEKTGRPLTLDTYENIVSENFTLYITKAVFKDRKLDGKVYFSVENSESGLDLVYSGRTPNKLFRWIADIDEEYTLMELIPTGVVYIRVAKTMQMMPFISENGNYYVYSKEEGKIKEVYNGLINPNNKK
jgi:hypothetical protein